MGKAAKCVFLDTGSFDTGDICWPDAVAGIDLVCYPLSGSDQLVSRLQSAEIIVTNKVVLDSELITQLKSLRLICIAATGTNNVDLEACRRLGISVCNVQAYATDSVVEHVFACLLSLQRQLPVYSRLAHDGSWASSRYFCVLDKPMGQLRGKTLGIIGYGELGQAVVHVAKAFGMEVLIAERQGAARIRDGRTGFDEVLINSDVISLHCPLTPETEGLIDAEALASMKSSAFLINTARGGVVRESDLLKALSDGGIAGAAVDVLAEEPPVKGNGLLDAGLDNLIVTPHVAWASVEARQNLLDGVFANIAAWQRSEPVNVVSV